MDFFKPVSKYDGIEEEEEEEEKDDDVGDIEDVEDENENENNIKITNAINFIERIINNDNSLSKSLKTKYS